MIVCYLVGVDLSWLELREEAGGSIIQSLINYSIRNRIYSTKYQTTVETDQIKAAIFTLSNELVLDLCESI